MLARPNLFDAPGGDTTQLLKTAEGLRALGAKVDISLDYEADTTPYDIVHIFNAWYPHQVYLFARNARRHNSSARVILSPIFIPPAAIPHGNPFERGWMSYLDSFRALWPVQSLYRRIAKGSRDAAESLLLRRSVRACERSIPPLIDLAIPNSISELEQFCRHFNFPPEQCQVAINAVEEDYGDCPPEAEQAWEKFRGGVLCVGGIMPNKNQMNLALAARKAGLPLTLVGPTPAPRYLAKLRRLEGPGLTILPPQPREALKGLYRVSHVHALVSHFETTGLVNLEAAMHGCRLVASARGYMRDYLGDHAAWCDPNDIESIAHALTQAMEQPKDFSFAEIIKNRFTWKKAATQTLSAYEKALELPKNG